uniref:Uncharacterized protein n=1 Tax=Meloidogyne floridensis TaxID=298350 RepID=A0A915NPD2_9BILA
MGIIYNIFNSDTRLWNIDHFTILNEYVAAMAILPFVVGSLHNDLKLNIYSNKVLIIGLGGGSLDMFWHKRFPWIEVYLVLGVFYIVFLPNLNITIFEINPNVVKLTEKWFDAVNDDTRHVFVQDGILAFNGKLINVGGGRKAVNNNDSQLYDAIVIDACDPIKNNSIKNKNKKQQENNFQHQMPYILACLPYSITQRRKSSKEPTELTNEMFNFWKIRLATLLREFGFKELLNDSTLMNF